MLLEVVAGTVEEAMAAEAAGADRIELCAGLVTAGVTPSIGVVRRVLAMAKVPVAVMVREREGAFVAGPGDLPAMCDSIQSIVAEGAQAIVACLLTEDGRIDRAANLQLVRACGTADPVFHRAFDQLPEPLEALEEVIDLGFRRILTSGCPTQAPEGVAGLTRLVEAARGRIEILPGGGVRATNAQLIASSGCTQLHFSMRTYSPTGVREPIQFDPAIAREVRDLYPRPAAPIMHDER